MSNRSLSIIACSVALGACSGRPPAPTDSGDAQIAAAVDGSLDAQLEDVAPVDTGVDVPPAQSHPAAAPLIQWVNPLMGTGGAGYGTGSMFPGPQTPFGMARPGPDTTEPTGAAGFSHCAGYSYGDTMIQGFSLTRMSGTGITDYGAIGLMPAVGMDASKTAQAGYTSAFDHATEHTSAGYYRVTLANTGTDVELTATDHVALQRYTFPAASDGVVLLDLGHTIPGVTIGAAHLDRDAATGEISGSTRFLGGYSGHFGGVTVYFAARTSRAAGSAGTWTNGVLTDAGITADGTAIGAYLHFDTSTDRTVTIAIGLSFTDVAHARANLLAEVPTIDFDTIRHATEASWEHVLSVAHIEGRSDADFRTFYSALYHTLLMPTLATDDDGTYRGIDGLVHTATGFRYYTDFSLWDTYRTEHPLLTLLYPDYQLDFVRSLVAMAHDSGFMPRWPLGTGETGGMLGESADIVLADSWLKGLRDFDIRGVYPIVRATAMAPAPAGTPDGRSGILTYLSRGYVSLEAAGSSVSNTIEYAYDDFALAILADAVGETADAAVFRMRSHNWRNLYDTTTSFLLGRHEDGTFATITTPTFWQTYYAEGNAWQYSFGAPHDVDGLAAAYGGNVALRARLDMLFTQTQHHGTMHILPMPYYWPGNEPDLHVAWLYAALDDAADTARWTHWIAANFYNDGPAGLPGNDDGGAMSAWYVWASLGMFPLAATTDYVLGSPLFTHVELTLAHGTVTVDAPDESTSMVIPTELRWNDAVLARPRLTHDQLTTGGTLHVALQ